MRSDVRILLRREESYAIHALVYLHENPGASAAQVARDLQMPAAFTAKVLQRLVVAGFAEAKQGRNGGVRVRVPLDTLTMLDIVESVSGTIYMDTCETKPACPTQQRKGVCRLNGAWVALTLQMREMLAAVRMSELVDDRPA